MLVGGEELIKQIKEILGRPIRLADVLYSIKQIKGDLEAMARLEEQVSDLCLTDWNLLSDDLTLQSPETVEFISKLLKS